MPHNNKEPRSLKSTIYTSKSISHPTSHKETPSQAIRVELAAEKYAVLSRRAAQEGISVELLVAQEIERISRA